MDPRIAIILRLFQEPVTLVAAPAQVVSYAAPAFYAQAPVFTYDTAAVPSTNLVYSNFAAPTLGYNIAAQAPIFVAASA